MRASWLYGIMLFMLTMSQVSLTLKLAVSLQTERKSTLFDGMPSPGIRFVLVVVFQFKVLH